MDSQQFFDEVMAIASENEDVFYDNESGVGEYLQHRWPEAFKEAQISTTEEGEEISDILPSLGEVADLGYDKINDHEKFINDLKDVIDGLKAGRWMRSGEFDD